VSTIHRSLVLTASSCQGNSIRDTSPVGPRSVRTTYRRARILLLLRHSFYFFVRSPFPFTLNPLLLILRLPILPWLYRQTLPPHPRARCRLPSFGSLTSFPLPAGLACSVPVYNPPSVWSILTLKPRPKSEPHQAEPKPEHLSRARSCKPLLLPVSGFAQDQPFVYIAHRSPVAGRGCVRLVVESVSLRKVRLALDDQFYVVSTQIGDSEETETQRRTADLKTCGDPRPCCCSVHHASSP
jgi:hypothetical protein